MVPRDSDGPGGGWRYTSNNHVDEQDTNTATWDGAIISQSASSGWNSNWSWFDNYLGVGSNGSDSRSSSTSSTAPDVATPDGVSPPSSGGPPASATVIPVAPPPPRGGGGFPP